MVKTKKTIKLISSILTLAILAIHPSVLSLSAATIDSDAVSAYESINTNITYYIKNANSGQYLDLDHGTDKNGTNIFQWKYNGGRNQQWKFVKVGNVYGGEIYKIVSVTSSSGKVVDVEHGGNSNNTNISLFGSHGGTNQQFALVKTSTGGYRILSKCSNYQSGLTIKNASCSQGGNVIQYKYNGTHNDEWLLEPVSKASSYGVNYAKSNYNKFPTSYPNLNDMGGDCANFVSQCLVAGGVHYSNSWYVYKKNNNYLKPSGVNQLNNSWQLADPSPWISAKQFNKYWSDAVNTYTYTAKDIINNPSATYNISNLNIGDVVQYGSNSWGFQGEHTMYITGYDSANKTYLLTYHSNSNCNKSLLEVCKANPNKIFRFFNTNN